MIADFSRHGLQEPIRLCIANFSVQKSLGNSRPPFPANRENNRGIRRATSCRNHPKAALLLGSLLRGQKQTPLLAPIKRKSARITRSTVSDAIAVPRQRAPR